MRVHLLAGTFAIVAASLLSGCCKKTVPSTTTTDTKTDPAKPATASGGAAGAPTPAAGSGADVPFKGTFTRYAETVFRNGQRLSTPDQKGQATVAIDAGKVTWVQNYQVKNVPKTITQVYTFTSDNVKTVPGGFHVDLTWASIEGDTATYNADKNRPKLEARKQAKGWEIGLTTTDDKNVQGGSEFH